MYQNEDKGLLV